MKVASQIQLTAFAITLTLAGSAFADCDKTADKIIGGLQEKIGTFSNRKSGVEPSNNGNTITNGSETASMSVTTDKKTVVKYSNRNINLASYNYEFTLNSLCKITQIKGKSKETAHDYTVTAEGCDLVQKSGALEKMKGADADLFVPSIPGFKKSGSSFPQAEWTFVGRLCKKYDGMFSDVADTKPRGTAQNKKSSSGNKSNSAK